MLKQLGLVVQVGHDDMLCYCPEHGHTNFLVIDINGIHPVSINFCGCEQWISHCQQLLQCAWYPSTVHNPRTACTRRVLDHFLRLTWLSKVSAYEYYHMLECLMDNTGINILKVCVTTLSQPCQLQYAPQPTPAVLQTSKPFLDSYALPQSQTSSCAT